MPSPRDLATVAIHAGQPPDPATGAVIPPIYQVSTFQQDGVGDTRGGYEYSRSANPTRTALESCLAALEGGRHGHAYASGLAAEAALLRAVCRPGDHVVIPGDAYGGTFRLLDSVLRDWDIHYTAVDFTTPDAVRAALRPATRLVLCESPTNPTLSIVDLAAIAGITREAGIYFAVDNTLASPALQRPLEHAADIVIHSTSKYLGGHSDVVGGALITDDDELTERLRFAQSAEGAVAGPFDCWLTLRGIKTLQVRMRQHCDNAERVAAMLSTHPRVSHVYYPGLPNHPGHELASKQMARSGGMVSFRVADGAEAAREICARTELFHLAVSLGGAESLLGYPAAMTHSSVSGTEYAVPDDLIRLSVGIEAIDDLLSDLQQALDQPKGTA